MKPRISKRQRNRQRWQEHIDAWKDSGLTQKVFCETHHLSFGSFRRWRRLFKAEAVATPNERVRFVPVKVTEPTDSILTVRFQEDWRIEVPSGFNPQLLQQVIQVLRSSLFHWVQTPRSI
jgi:hypothetical protein